MTYSNEEIYKKALLRIARVFGISVDVVLPTDKFGKELRNSFVSDFKLNELDKILYDIQDVADYEIMKEIKSGKLSIETVDEYCSYMVRCHKINCNRVEEILAK